jgi:hypothetical protein
MLMTMPTHACPPVWSFKNSLRNTLDACLLPLQLLHILCILCGPLVMMGYVSWALLTGSWSLAGIPTWRAFLATCTPWQALGLFGVAYSGFIWLVYVLPVWTKEFGHTRMMRELRFPRPALWKHAVLWGLVFGPLLQQLAAAAVLSWPLLGLVAVGLLWGFYEILGHDVRWVRQRHCEASKMSRLLANRS